MRFTIKLAAAAAAFGLAIGAAHSAQATTTFSYDFEGADWGSSDFTTVGAAHYSVAGLGGLSQRLRLTSSGGGLVGSAWNNTALFDPSMDWQVTFDYQTTYNSGGGGDGLAFHLQTGGLSANPTQGGSGLTNALTVNVDTYQNPGEGSDYMLEVGIDGVEGSANSMLGLASGIGCVNGLSPNDCDSHVMRVTMTYTDATNSLVVWWANMTLGGVSQGLITSLDLAALIGTGNIATFGFSGNTGGAAQNNDILKTNGYFVPEPGTLLLLTTGLVGLGISGRKKA